MGLANGVLLYEYLIYIKMNTNHNIREDKPENINPDEVGKNHPSKTIKAQEKIDIKESELGREQGQTPADEHIESNLSQIDNGTIELQKQSVQKTEDYADEINDTDVRDQNDSTTDWDAENSKTGRHK